MASGWVVFTAPACLRSFAPELALLASHWGFYKGCFNMLALCLALLSSSSPSPAQDSPERQNILLIIADDVGTEMLRPYGIGTSYASTPTINSLASESVLFRNAWSSPVCSPTRACIQTGRLGFRTGIGMTIKNQVTFSGLQSSEIILPEMLDAGTGKAYRHALFGKWHLNHSSANDSSGAPVGNDVVREQGYEHFAGIIHNIVAPDSYFDWPKVTDGVASKSTKYATTATVDDFLSWRASIQEPYFAVVSFNAPHSPLHTPPSDLYSFDLSGSWSPKVNPRDYYKAMLEALDTELGRLLGSIDADLDHTTVIFMGDNGTPGVIVNSDPDVVLPNGHAKGTAYEGGVNIPLMVSGPGVDAAGFDCTALVHAVDIFATVAELAEVNLGDPEVFPADRTLDSLSLVPYFTEPDRASARRYNFTEKFFENTLEGAQVDESQLRRPPFCQQVVESTFDPKDPVLSVCGQAIVEKTDNFATIRIAHAPPEAPIYLLAGGNKPAPNPLYNGLVTLSPNPMSQLRIFNGKVNLNQPFTSDAQGGFELPGLVHQINNVTDYYLQAAIQDPVSKRWMITNAVQINQTIGIRGVVSADGYKLIVYPSGGPTELYYLADDPRETIDLLETGIESLSDSEAEAYANLRHAMDSKLQSGQ